MRSKSWLSNAVLIGCSLACILCGCSDKNPVAGKPDDGPESIWKLQIQTTHQTLQGHYQNVALTMTASSETMGSFEFLIGFDASALNFTGAEMGASLTQCGWEYFTYRYSFGLGTDYPSGLVRLVGIAETNNGPSHPDWSCLEDIAGDTLATLTFLISNDRRLECMFQPIQFFWAKCTDNAICVADGDSIALNQRVFDAYGKQIQDYDLGLPGIHGAPDDSCLNAAMARVTRFRSVDFINGGIDIVCTDTIDNRGDLNNNCVANEIADAVIFIDYFMDGLSVFGDHTEASIAASDVNADGTSLSLEDFVFLIRVIVGDALPYGQSPDVIAEVAMKNGHVTINSPAAVGAVLLVFNAGGDVGQPILNVPGMDMLYAFHGSELRVLIYNIGHNKISAGTTDIVAIPGAAKLTGAEVAGYEGYRMNVHIVQSQ